MYGPSRVCDGGDDRDELHQVGCNIKKVNGAEGILGIKTSVERLSVATSHLYCNICAVEAIAIIKFIF